MTELEIISASKAHEKPHSIDIFVHKVKQLLIGRSDILNIVHVTITE